MTHHIKLELSGLADYFQGGSNGMFWPTAHNEDDGHGWVTRVDCPEEWEQANEDDSGIGPKVAVTYDSDDDAAVAMLGLLVGYLTHNKEFDLIAHLRLGWAVPVGCVGAYPYIDIDEAFFVGKEMLS